MVTRIRILAGLLSLAALLVASSGAGPAQAVLVHDFDFAGDGTAGGELGDPAGIAINNTTGDVYVVETGNNRVSQFTASGTFIRTWGFDVVATGKPNDHGDAFEICDTTAGNLPEDCKAGQATFDSGSLSSPTSIAIDNSTGPAAGSVYIGDNFHLRIQRFDADGNFVLMWGKDVNATSGGDLCPRPGNPGDVCQNGVSTADPAGFSGTGQGSLVSSWLTVGAYFNRLSTDGVGNVYASSGNDYGGCCGDSRVVRFDSTGNVISQIQERPGSVSRLFTYSGEIAADATGAVYVKGLSGFDPLLMKFPASDFTPSGLTPGNADGAFPYYGEEISHYSVDPTNQHLFVVDSGLLSPCQDIVGYLDHIIQIHPGGELADCSSPTTPGMEKLNGGSIRGLAVSPAHKLYMAVNSEVRVFDTPVASPPAVDSEAAFNITTNSARFSAQMSANLASTTFRVEYGISPCSELPNPCASTPEAPAGASFLPKTHGTQINDLTPNTTYYYRFILTSDEGTDVGSDKSFKTFSEPVFDPSCPNNLARQQTGAGFVLDCRAYELVSASDQGGYNVASDLISGQVPFGGYPRAKDKALYAMHNGGVPGTGKPTNRGPDPYVATRDAANQRWNTTYVGVPADAPSLAPFSSTLAGADSSLDTFAFSGSEICDPCFPDGSAGIPVHMPDGNLAQGMVGSLPVPLPEPAAGVEKHLSADGSHFLFASEQLFEPAGNPNDGNVTIYDRNLKTATTQVVSTMPDGSTIANGQEVVALDISEDGSHVLIGDLVSTDAEGNDYYDLYMHVGTSSSSFEIVSGGGGGALYDGMTADGTQVFFTTRANLAGDTDSSADLFRATLDGGVSIERVSAGVGGTGDDDSCDPAGNSINTKDWNAIPGGPTDCSVVALGGGNGVATESGGVYFLSPEPLDGNGTSGAPNLFFAAPGAPPHFVSALESGATTPLPPPVPIFERSMGSFVQPNGVAIDEQDGSVYVYDQNGAPFGPGPYVQKFDAEGNPDTSFGVASVLDGANSGAVFQGTVFSPVPTPAQIAVDNDPASPNYGDLYVPNMKGEGFEVGGEVIRFDSSGNYEAKYEVAPFGTFSIATAVTVSPDSGRVYAAGGSLIGFGSFVRAFDVEGTTGDLINPTDFPVSELPFGVAVDSTERLFVADGGSLKAFDGAPGGGFGSSLGVFAAGPAFGVAVDSSNDHVFIDRGDVVTHLDSAGTQIGTPIGSGLLSSSVSLTASEGGLVVSNAGAGNVAVFAPDTAPDRAYDSPLVIDSVRDAEVRSADFQTTPSGDHAVFSSTLPLTGFASEKKYELYRYDAVGDQLVCASCTATGLPPTDDARLASNGLSISDDGRVFFNTEDPLSLRDLNGQVDVYEWSPEFPADHIPGACRRPDGCLELVSSGKDRTGAGLLSVSSDGTDVFFFTRESLAANDTNGNVMKLYDARESGGFFVIPPQPECKASDECHGPGSQAAPPPFRGTGGGIGGNLLPKKKTKPCGKGKVRRNGKCVRKKRPHRGKHRRPTTPRHG